MSWLIGGKAACGAEMSANFDLFNSRQPVKRGRPGHRPISIRAGSRGGGDLAANANPAGPCVVIALAPPPLPPKLPAVLIGLLLLVGSADASGAMTRIEDDMGGSLGKYLLMFAEMRDAGERVMIDGSCFSACTLVTAMVPKNRVCITERARLGFHATWVEEESGRRVTSAAGTQLLYQMYPPVIRKWIARHGGLGARTLVMEGHELAAVYQRCR